MGFTASIDELNAGQDAVETWKCQAYPPGDSRNPLPQ